MNKGSLIVLSGFSGAGKGTVIAQVLAKRPDVYFSVSFTTREPREGEKDGVNYHFVSREEFEARIAQGEFLEYAQYVDNYYGTSRRIIQEKLDQGIDVLLEIEVQGAAHVRENMPESVSLFIVPPSFEELSRRLHGRGTDSEEKIQERLATARKEIKEIVNYDYIVINDTVEQAVEEVLSILTAAGCRKEQRLHLIEGV